MSRAPNNRPWRRTPRVLTVGRILLIVLLLVRTAPIGARAQVPEYDVKAAFLFNIAKYVEWSAEALPAGDPITIATVGNDPFGKALDQLAGRKVNGREIRISRRKGINDLQNVQVVFFSSSNKDYAREISVAAKSLNAVTVGDTPESQDYTAINLAVDGSGRIVFTANLANVRSPSVRISSKLLHFAKSVRKSGASGIATR